MTRPLCFVWHALGWLYGLPLIKTKAYIWPWWPVPSDNTQYSYSVTAVAAVAYSSKSKRTGWNTFVQVRKYSGKVQGSLQNLNINFGFVIELRYVFLQVKSICWIVCIFFENDCKVSLWITLESLHEFSSSLNQHVLSNRAGRPTAYFSIFNGSLKRNHSLQLSSYNDMEND